MPQRHRPLLLLAALACLLLSPVPARANCIWSDLVRGDARAAVVRPGPKQVHFLTLPVLRAGCPQAGARCLSQAYVVPGDIVLVGHAEGAFTCAGFQGVRGPQTIEYLPSTALALLPAAQQAPGDWAGRWTALEHEIAIRPAPGGALAVNGEATWGMGDAWRRANGAVNTGEITGIARPVGGMLAFTQSDERTLPYGAGAPDDCRVRMIRRGPYLLVRDNRYCGGENVSFSGFYGRHQEKGPRARPPR